MNNFSWPTTRRAREKLLDNALSPLLRISLEKLQTISSELNFPLYIVGGFVRDLILGRHPSDLDLVVEGDAIKLGNSFISKHGGEAFFHKKFRTASIILHDQQGTFDPLRFDLVSTRAELYSKPGALPIIRAGTLSDDLNRRDFSINTLAVRLDGEHRGELVDRLGGLNDLNSGIVRILHRESFTDDPTRIFRAIRYAVRYGYKLSPETKSLILTSSKWIENLSSQRLRHELELIMDEADSGIMLLMLSRMKVLQAIQKNLTVDKRILIKMKIPNSVPGGLRRQVKWTLWLKDLSHDDRVCLENRLKFKGSFLKIIHGSLDLYSRVGILTSQRPSQVVRLLDELPNESIVVVSYMVHKGETKRILENYLTKWQYIKQNTSGNTLKQLEVIPGPRYKEILQMLRDSVLDGQIKSNEDEKRLLEDIIH